jgi:hypothetical protein
MIFFFDGYESRAMPVHQRSVFSKRSRRSNGSDRFSEASAARDEIASHLPRRP